MTTPSDEPGSPLEGARQNRPSLRVLPRYLLFQLPGWIIVVTASVVGSRWWDLPLWIWIAAPLAWVGIRSARTARASRR